MTAKRLVIVAAVSAVGLALAWGTFGIARHQLPAFAAEIIAQPVHFGGHHSGWSHGRRGGHLRALCSERRDERIEDLVIFVEDFVDFTPAQSDAWTELTAALRTSSQAVGKTCDEIAEQGRPDTAPELLASAESVMATGLGVVREVRPAFERFYSALDEKQQAAIDRLVARRHRH